MAIGRERGAWYGDAILLRAGSTRRVKLAHGAPVGATRTERASPVAVHVLALIAPLLRLPYKREHGGEVNPTVRRD